jgi:hypothetical protein
MPIQVHAASKNAKAHTAYKKAMATSASFQWLREYIDGNGVQYKFMDLNKDKLDELIIETYHQDRIFTYHNGKVLDLKATNEIFSSGWVYYYKAKSIVSSGGGHTGNYWTLYTKIYKGKSKIVAKEYGVDYDPKTESDLGYIKYKYYVNGKKVSKSKYKSYVKSITKGKRETIKNYKTFTHANISKWAKL